MSRDMTMIPQDEAAETAALWCIRLSEGELAENEWAVFEAWLAEPGHAELFQEAATVWRSSGEVGDWPQLIALRTEALTTFRRLGQRRWFVGKPRRVQWIAAAATVLLTLAVSLGWYLNRPREYETHVGERQVAVLDDGSRASLDAVTAMNVRMQADGRQVELLHGRAKFDVAKDPLRPFTVVAGDKLIVAVGTSFSVELIDREVRVILYEGQVEVRDRNDRAPSDASASAAVPGRHLLTPGAELVEAMGSAVPARITRPDLTQSLSWESGLLNFDDEPLASAVERMNRYSARKIRLVDPSLGDIRVDGIFQAGDLDAFAEGLAVLHPVKERVVADGLVIERR
ncbi:MAG: FecR domain-containing protein [Sphingopyxis sp.]|uniref:FecR family protein n=1 Tax=Sphingopyxis sp. TaxID=1908224 RepID=UPI002AB9C120|nr:FecR domain-containing protein [Sphingopyxis sp.]MDZ3831878.1 FecR domain-containing protein [Sphingopyxis sp.]